MNNALFDPTSNFKRLHARPIEALNLHVVEYEHIVTGARHLHLHNKSKENVFMVALRTVPNDSTGVAHILEHTALCGSKHYPVRDPFFMMLRRSLNTFMNAFTGSDWTAYPFATQNYQDFDNLLRVYLDAVFFPLLDPLDFAQEGHRLERVDPESAKSDLRYCGVVYNEMKGAMSTTSSQLWHDLCAAMYPSTTYQHNSGGDPAQIPNLSHQQLLDFHRRYYHPSNATFMTFGDIPPKEHQEKFQELTLKHFEREDTDIMVPPERSFKGPRHVKTVYSAQPEDLKEKNNAHLIISWLLSDVTDLDRSANMRLISSILLDNSASPLRQLLETSKYGKTPSSMTGMMDEHRELMLLCGIEGACVDDMESFQADVMGLLERVATEGVDIKIAESALHQYELQHREITGDTYPYGLQLLLRCLPAVLYRGSVLAALDTNQLLKRLAQDIQKPDFIGKQVQEMLLDNSRRLSMSAEPDVEFNERQNSAEREKLESLNKRLDEDAKANMVDLAQALQKRQQQLDPSRADILPKLQLSDVPNSGKKVSAPSLQKDPLPVTGYQVATNGLVYQQAVLPMPQLSEQHMQILPLYTNMVTELGVGTDDYLETQKLQASISGGVSCSCSLRSAPDDVLSTKAHMVFATRSLQRNVSASSQLLRDTLHDVRFDEHDRIRELLSQMRVRTEEHITQAGHQLAMNAATANMSPMANLAYQNSGLPGIRRLKALDTSIHKSGSVKDLADQLLDLHKQVIAQKPELLLVAEQSSYADCLKQINDVWKHASGDARSASIELPTASESPNQLWRVQTQVNFCARAWSTVPSSHEDAPVLAVLSHLMRNGFLHRAIREQGGAYGGGARQDSSIGSFMFFSYRDPRLEETLGDFERALEWLHTHKHDPSQLEEAILGVMSGLDKPGSPAGAVMHDFHGHLYGYTHALRERYRKAVLNTTLKDLLRVADQYLQASKAHTAVVVPLNAGQKLLSKGYALQELSDAQDISSGLVA